MPTWKELPMVGKTVIITGGNRSIGQETSFQLAKRGAKVIIACRDVEQGERARTQITKDAKNELVFVKKLDLSILDNVRTFARDILDNEDRLDVLICNAGSFFKEKIVTEDGFESTLAVNYLGHFLLVNLLLPLLKKSQPSRVIMLSSIAYLWGKIDFENLNSEKSFSSMSAYSSAKLAVLMFAKELGWLLKNKGVTVNAIHPGYVATELFDNISGPMNYVFKAGRCLGGDAKSGAETSVYLAVSEDVAETTGKLFYWNKQVPKIALLRANNLQNAKELWATSCELVKINSDLK